MFHGFGTHRHRGRQMFEKGALKYLVLDLISTRPRHGYDIIRELEESSGGCYTPSPGTIYPTLQMLDDLGYIQIKKENGKKVYEITDEGRAYLDSHKDSVRQHREHMAACFPSGAHELGSMMREMKGLVGLVVQTSRGGSVDPAKAAAIREVLDKARKDIEHILAGESAK